MGGHVEATAGEAVLGLVAAQQVGRGDVLAFLVGSGEQLGEGFHAAQAEVEAVGGDGVHAHSSVTDDREALGHEALCPDTDQGVGVARAAELHGAELVGEALANGGVEGAFFHVHQGLQLAVGQGEHDR